MEVLHFRKHAAPHAFQEACMDTLLEYFFLCCDTDEQRVIFGLSVNERNSAYLIGDLERADESDGVVSIDRFGAHGILFRKKREEFFRIHVGEGGAEFWIRFDVREHDAVDDGSDIKSRSSADDGKFPSPVNIIDRFFCVTLPVCDGVDTFWGCDVEKVMGNPPHLLFGDFSGSDIHSAIDLSRVCRHNLSMHAECNIDRQITFPRGCRTDDGHYGWEVFHGLEYRCFLKKMLECAEQANHFSMNEENCMCGDCACESDTPMIGTLSIGDTLPTMELSVYDPKKDDLAKVNTKDLLGKWVVYFFYPADFTFVCPTELEEMAGLYAEFQKEGAEVLSVSTDTAFAHKAWHDTSDAIKKIEYPMVADPDGSLSMLFGTYITEGEDAGLSLRGSFIVDPKGVLKTIEIHDNAIGRSGKELLRKLRAAKFVAEHGGNVCPASWEPGDDTLKPGIDLVGKI